MRTRGFRRFDFTAKVRLFALLSFLSLLVILLSATMLFTEANVLLGRELEERLALAARLGGQRLEEHLPRPAGGSLPALRARAQGLLEALQRQTGVARLVLILPDGSHVETPVPAGRRPVLPPAEAWEPQPEAGRSLPRVLFTDYHWAGGGYFRTLFWPLREPEGPAWALLAVEERADFLGFLDRVRWILPAVTLAGLGGAALLGWLFLRAVLRPYAALAAAARDLQALTPEPLPEAGEGDLESVPGLFRRLVGRLQRQEAELSRLYAGADRRGGAAAVEDSILGSITSGIISVRPDLTLRVFNRPALHIFGLTEGEVVGRPCQEVFGPGGAITLLAGEALATGKTHSRLELVVTRPDGAARWVGLASSVVRDGRGEAAGVTFLLTDLTEVRRLQEQVTLQESLAKVGQLSAGIAHEVRNALGAILGFAKLLKKHLTAEDPRAVHVQAIIDETNSLETTLRDFLTYARPARLQVGTLAVRDLVEEALDPYRVPLQESGVAVSCRHEGREIQIQGDRTALRQALGNLIRNALEAMPRGGRLVLVARRLPEGPQEDGAAPVEIRVEDTGEGIATEDAGRIFTPFFTTKERGTGLGLALAQKAVVAHGGRIEVESRPGVGTTFRIILPAKPTAAHIRGVAA
ncbi:MAG: PAS domain-containing protein [candidate division NC10 bacterium]|nr:PAS domain-containing protein [candidate division NC10 bacterium]